uniref:Myotubularin related protein 11 n=1 Tax=Sphenodon punctatus TaxID=8508 RepID=A0A8D0G1U8_SPHPU
MEPGLSGLGVWFLNCGLPSCIPSCRQNVFSSSPPAICLAGEYVQEEASCVRKSVLSRDGKVYVPGTLYCTNLRVVFLPDPSPSTEVVNSFTKAKVLTASSTLKFIPEELVVYCRDFRVLKFHFHESGLEPQAFRVTMAIAQARESGAACLSENGQAGREEEEEEIPTLLFESLCDWEMELKRLRASSWRVSPVNERFDMSTSLPKYLWVPALLLDNELKRAFAHFNERRVPRLCWHHPGGSVLLRAASFHADSDPEKEDMRSVETLLLAGHSQCVIVDTAADLPSPAEIQQAYLKLRALYSSLVMSDEKWLSALEGTRWLEHVRSLLGRSFTLFPSLLESDDRELNCLLASLVQMVLDPHARTLSGFQSLLQKEWVASGHPFLQRLNLLRQSDRDEVSDRSDMPEGGAVEWCKSPPLSLL